MTAASAFRPGASPRGRFMGGAAMPKPHVSNQPVWRNSYDVNDKRADPARKILDGTVKAGRLFVEKWLETAFEWANHTRKDGEVHQLTGNAIKLMRDVMTAFLKFEDGRCEVTLESIMRATRFSRPTVVRLLARLRALGWIDWIRRTEKTGNKPGEGPQIKQAANAYFFEVSRLPIEAQRRLRQKLKQHEVKTHPDRVGSGPVPGLMQRKVSALARGLTGLFKPRGPGPAEMADMDQRLEAAQPHERAAILYPNDPDAQAEYNALIAASLSRSASCGIGPDPRLQIKRERNGDA